MFCPGPAARRARRSPSAISPFHFFIGRRLRNVLLSIAPLSTLCSILTDYLCSVNIYFEYLLYILFNYNKIIPADCPARN